MSEGFCDLVTDNGEIIRVSYPSDIEDEFWDTVENEIKQRGWLPISRWEGCKAVYLGHRIDRVNMGKVIACL